MKLSQDPHYAKALERKYGRDASDLVKLADRVVAQGLFPTRRAAIAAVEEQMELGVTQPLTSFEMREEQERVQREYTLGGPWVEREPLPIDRRLNEMLMKMAAMGRSESRMYAEARGLKA